MPHITLSVPEDVYREMKKRPDIKWSEVARESIVLRLVEMKNVSHASELRSRISPDVFAVVSALDESKAKKLYRRMVKEKWKHVKYSTRT